MSGKTRFALLFGLLVLSLVLLYFINSNLGNHLLIQH